MSLIFATLDIETAGTLRAVIGRLSRRLRPTPAALAAGLTPTRSSVLLTVVREGPVRLSDLADMRGHQPDAALARDRPPARGGLIERTSDQGDRRAAWVKATTAGRRLSERIRRERTDALNVALAELPGDQRKLIEKALPALEQLAEQLKGERS